MFSLRYFPFTVLYFVFKCGKKMYDFHFICFHYYFKFYCIAISVLFSGCVRTNFIINIYVYLCVCMTSIKVSLYLLHSHGFRTLDYGKYYKCSYETGPSDF